MPRGSRAGFGGIREPLIVAEPRAPSHSTGIRNVQRESPSAISNRVAAPVLPASAARPRNLSAPTGGSGWAAIRTARTLRPLYPPIGTARHLRADGAGARETRMVACARPAPDRSGRNSPVGRELRNRLTLVDRRRTLERPELDSNGIKFHEQANYRFAFFRSHLIRKRRRNHTQ